MAQRMDGEDIGGPSFQYRFPLEGVNRRGGDGVIAFCLLELEPQQGIASNKQTTHTVIFSCPPTYG